MSTFKAVRIDKVEGGTKAAFVDFDEKDLMAGDVDVRVSYSTVNYKDELAVTGKSPVVRRFPMIPGIDFAGTVKASRHPEFKPGDKVVLNGWGVGETHLGGYAQRARVSGDWLIGLPAGLSAAEAMAIGTAGYTAMLALMAIERHGVRPEHGPALVTGASGGVGSVAIALLAKAGWHVIAMTGRPQEASYLKELGAAEIIDRGELAEGGKPLMAERWAAGIDSVGSRLWRMRSPTPRPKVPLQPAASPRASICRRPSRHSSCAAFPCSASTVSWSPSPGVSRPGGASPVSSIAPSSRR